PLRRKCLLWDCTTPLECGMIGKLRFPRNGGPFMPELLLPGNIISMDARAADRLTACGNGDAALLYLWLLRHGGQLDPAKARKGLKWDGQRLEDASAALVNLGLSDGKAEEAAPIPAPEGPPDYTAADITR